MKERIKLRGRTVTVIGSGISGTGLALLAGKQGAQVLVSELKDHISEDTKQTLRNNNIGYETGGHSERAWETDLVLLSSGVGPGSIAVKEALTRNISFMGELDFIYPYLNGTTIGITGSNGKTTTTSLVNHFLHCSGQKVTAAGNIGLSLAEAVLLDQDYLVIELSSFQLYWINNFQVDMAVMTNLAPDHLDWHGNFNNYVTSKVKLLNSVRKNGWAILQGRDYFRIDRQKNRSVALLDWESDKLSIHDTEARILLNDDCIKLQRKGLDSKVIAETEQIPLIGRHNLENTAMALSVIDLLGLPLESSFVPSLMNDFVPLSHRCELVATVNGIRYIDDSKGTNVAASVAAMASIEGEKIVILGGKGKGEDYTPLAQEVSRSSYAAILIGEEKDPISSALTKEGYSAIFIASSMEDAVQIASSIARVGSTVLLSPACTSWDMYENYQKRGDHFKKVVKNLEKWKGCKDV